MNTPETTIAELEHYHGNLEHEGFLVELHKYTIGSIEGFVKIFPNADFIYCDEDYKDEEGPDDPEVHQAVVDAVDLYMEECYPDVEMNFEPTRGAFVIHTDGRCYSDINFNGYMASDTLVFMRGIIFRDNVESTRVAKEWMKSKGITEIEHDPELVFDLMLELGIPLQFSKEIRDELKQEVRAAELSESEFEDSEI